MYQMGISTFDIYFNKIKKILNCFDDFCEDLEHEHKFSLLDNNPNPELEETVEQITNIKIKGDEEKVVTKKKVLGFLYKQSINFLQTDKISSSSNGCLTLSKKFLINLFYIYTDRHVVHHSHVTGKIIGHAHEYCNFKVRENYYTIPAIAHNQFRFDFFLFLKGLRPSIWEKIPLALILQL